MDAKKPLISVIVPVYNVEKYLPKCLDSLLAQTWQELEIIVVDDGSPDNSWDIMQEYARRDSRVRPIRQKNGGLSAARNAGVEAARGEWIGFLDSDDYVAPEMYERLYRAAAEQGAQMAVCSFTYVTPDGKPIPRTSPITKNEVLSGIQMMERLAGPQNWYYITAWNRLYQKKLFDTVRFPVGKLHEDEYTAHLFYWQCERVAIVKEAMYYYVQQDGSIMHTESVRKRVEGAAGMLERADFALEHEVCSLAFASCNGALGRIVFAKGGSEEERQALRQVREQADRIIDRLLRVPGYRTEKAKVALFRLSPALYHLALKIRGGAEESMDGCENFVPDKKRLTKRTKNAIFFL